MSKRTVDLVHEPSAAASAPLLVSFRGGPPLTNTGFHCQVYEHAAKKKRIVVADTEKVTYQAANFGHGNSNGDLSSYVVGVVDKDTNTVQLFNVDQVYVMQQSVKSFRENVDDNTQDSVSYSECQKNLVDVFGSKASKRIVRSREENKIQVENIRGASSITQTFSEKVQENSDLLAAKRAADPKFSADGFAMDATRLAMLPPCKLDALTPDGVYDISKFLSNDVMESLLMKADEFISVLSTSALSEFLAQNDVAAANYITQVMTSMGKPYDRENVALMLYVMYLVQFFQARYPLQASAASLSETMNVPHLVVKQILGTFAEATVNSYGKTSYAQSKVLKDKLLLYLLVVALTIGGFSLDVSAIAADLKRAPSNIIGYTKQVGCRVDKVKTDSSGLGGKKSESFRAILTLPLQFPSLKKGGPSRR
ncbi:hypothetical protein H310_00147 [Aphanomyces invadans]|uniref:DNA-directed RNA polymerase I subunit RPA49 n=1 Tax=Aphanomyces invadans TaxID=157072 RepID=A0A024UUH8_9STRA|nr:hypothetical protein H310_00147 [Aphanomyces invadans]ETW09610.1 hypothetical protein H310_00147 [Aphanomyces invadans]|eukprot:XP_008861021.1 hypothetical protein H310_00147 [Aphanomyces invadans]